MWGLVCLGGIVAALRRRTDLDCLLLCCALVGVLYLSLGTVDLTEYFPMNHQARYLIPLLPMLALLSARMVADVLGRSTRTQRVVLTIAAVVCAGSLLGPNKLAGRMYRARTFEAGRRQ